LTAPLTAQTPQQIDTTLEALYLAELKAENTVTAAIIGIRRALGHKSVTTGRGASKRTEWPCTTAEAVTQLRAKGDAPAGLGSTAAAIVNRYDQAVTHLQANLADQEPLHAEYVRRGGWTRFYIVSGGHIHSSMRCPTCNRGQFRTEFGWQPTMSGMDETAALTQLAEQAFILCTVCFPNAPVQPAAPRKTAADKAADKAAADRRARTEDPKLIADVDGGPLRVDGNTLRTVRAADIAAVDHLWWAAFGRHVGDPNEPYAVEHEGHARRIVAALAVKNGTTAAAELDRVTGKAVKKVRRDLGADVAAAAAAVWAAGRLVP
jgi:hypothetical protein